MLGLFASGLKHEQSRYVLVHRRSFPYTWPICPELSVPCLSLHVPLVFGTGLITGAIEGADGHGWTGGGGQGELDAYTYTEGSRTHIQKGWPTYT
jgi:hypothetical protein